jgi:carbonic anhydrase
MSPLLGDGYKAGRIETIKPHPLVPKDIVVRGFIIDSEIGELEEAK